jgi:hypothetical protein
MQFKARASDLFLLEQLVHLNPKFICEDQETDTYFKVAKGRLKLREGILKLTYLL